MIQAVQLYSISGQYAFMRLNMMPDYKCIATCPIPVAMAMNMDGTNSF